MKSVIRLTALAFMTLALLTACGGDDSLTGNAGSGGGTNGGGSALPGQQVAAVVARTSTTQIASDGSQPATITAVVKNANNNVVPNVPVTFSADSGTLQVTQGTTDDTGTAIATLSTDGNAANRTIGVTVTAGNASDRILVAVDGTALSINGPSSVASQQTADYVIRLTDAAGGGIAGQNITLTSESGNTFSTSTLTTNAQGEVSATLNASVPGADVLTAQAVGASESISVNISDDLFTLQLSGSDCDKTQSGMPVIPLTASCTLTVHWEKSTVPQSGKSISFDTTRGSFIPSNGTTDSTGEASAALSSTSAGLALISVNGPGGSPSAQLDVRLIATKPDSIAVQADNATIGPNGTTIVTAVVRDANNNLVSGANVNFQITTDSTGGFLSVGTVETDFQGRAQTVYTAGSTTSAQNGVTIVAEVSDSIGGLVASDQVALTVAGRAISLTLGTGNEIEIPNIVQYSQPYVVQVADASGNPVTDATVDLSITSLRYLKGCWRPVADGTAPPASAACGTDPTTTTGSISAATETYAQYVTVSCPNEDINLNGQLDSTPPPGEDTDGDGKLDPGVVAVVTPDTVSTDSTGSVLFDILYPKDRAFWAEVSLTATASVAGTEQSSSVTFFLRGAAEDYNDSSVQVPGAVSPFGIQDSCATAG